MNGFPDEYELLSLFGCEPKLFDTNIKDLSFFYNQATYEFSNQREKFIVTLSPSYKEVKIQVSDLLTDEIISYLDLKDIDKFEIVADKVNKSSILITINRNRNDIIQTLEVDFKPKFKLIFKEHFLR